MYHAEKLGIEEEEIVRVKLSGFAGRTMAVIVAVVQLVGMFSGAASF